MTDAKSSNHTTRATYELRQKIVGGEIPGGTRLYEVALSEQLSISRTPVREAMSRLAEEGLLERARGGGFVVRSFTFADAADAIELRGILEGTAARLAAERGTSDASKANIRAVLRKLDSCFAGQGLLSSFEGYSAWNAEFHHCLAQMCGSAIVIRELERVTSLPFASPSAFVLGAAGNSLHQPSLVLAQAQHHAMVEAIENREGTRAESLAREHARIARANLERTFTRIAAPGPLMPAMALIIR